MNRFQQFLVIAIVIESVTVAFDCRLLRRMRQLPPVNWNAGLVDDMTARQIRSLERRFDPSDAVSWIHLGLTYRAFGMFPQGEYCYRHADQLSPKDRGYLYTWAECDSLMGQTAEARKIYHRIIDEQSTEPLGLDTTAYCWLNIGQDYLREENVPAALDAFRKAGDIPKAKFLASRVLIRAGRAQEALVLLDQLLSNAPTVLEYNQMKSWAEAALGNTNAAEDFYERSLRTETKMERLDPTFYEQTLKLRELSGGLSLQLKSLRLEQQGLYPEALKSIREALGVCWTEDRAGIEARLESRLGHNKEAIAIVEDSIRRTGASAPLLEIMAVAYESLGNRDKAREALEQAVAIEPRAELYLKLADLTDDIDGKTRCQSLAQYCSGKQAWLTDGLTEAGLRDALDHFQKATDLFNGHAHTWFYLAETRRYLGDGAGAEAAYKRCLQLNPDDGRALRGLDRLGKK